MTLTIAEKVMLEADIGGALDDSAADLSKALRALDKLIDLDPQRGHSDLRLDLNNVALALSNIRARMAGTEEW